MFRFSPGANSLESLVFVVALFFDGVDLVEDEAEAGGEGGGLGVVGERVVRS